MSEVSNLLETLEKDLLVARDSLEFSKNFIEQNRQLIMSALELMDELERQCDNMAFVVNHATLPNQWLEKLSKELEEAREILSKAKGERNGLGR